jgi:EmrB/QacA subfamily drug resistance transporter
MSSPAAGEVELDSHAGRIVLGTVVLGSAVAMLTATVVNVALPTLASDLDATSSEQKWIVNAYTLTLAALILIGGSLGDRWGRVRVYRIGVVWFAVASALCALSWDTTSLIVFRLLQGVGGALLTPGSLAIIQATLRPDDRGRGVGLWSGIGGVAGAIGPLVGGLLVEASWRWVFVVNLPVAAAAFTLSFWVPETRDETAADSDLDLGGAALTALLLGTASYALIEGPEGDVSALELACVVVAVGSAGALWWVERGRDHAMLPLDLFSDKVFAAANAVTFTIYGGMAVLFFLLSVQLQVTAEWSPLEAGTALLPVTALMLLLSARAGELASRIGPRLPLTVGSMVVALGMVLMTRVGAGAAFWGDVLPAVTVFGLGLALIVAPVTSTALNAVPDERAGAASGVNNAVARTAGLFAVAAIPGFVGLTGDALSDPAQLDDGFEQAMLVAAALVALAGVLAFVLLPSDPALCADRTSVRQAACPVTGEASMAGEAADV